MDRLTMFVPLLKADAAQRLVWGRFDESPDRANEVFDYETSKPLIKAWSDEQFAASDGKSYGNIRAQHGKNAAGKLVAIEFDDMGKAVGFCAKIVDDADWAKVEEGVYTGFSPGGRYAKRWQDGMHKRYTAGIAELSIVDVPCNRNATFTMVKADGTEAEVEFVMSKAYEPGNEATKTRADEMAKAAGKEGKGRDYVGKARADLIAENAEAELVKVNGEIDEPVVDEKPDPVAALDAALAKAGATTETETPDELKAVIDDIGQNGSAYVLLSKSLADQPLLAKGMYTLERVGSAMERFASIATEVCYEERAEGDAASKLPQMSMNLVKGMRDLLVEMANEETAELLADVGKLLPEYSVIIVDGAAMALASEIVDLVKADTGLMEKAASRPTALVAEPDKATKEALTAAEADRDRLAKAVMDSVPRIEELAGKLEKISAERDEDRTALTKANEEIERLKAQPLPAKGQLIVMEKGAKVDDATTTTRSSDPRVAAIDAMPSGPEKAKAIIEYAGAPGGGGR